MVQSKKKQKAIQLRLQGKSYGEILKELNLTSKGTLSNWFCNLKLPLSAHKRLRHNILLARKRGLFAFNKQRTKRVVVENNEIFNEAIKRTPLISKDNLLLIGAALYWGEGALREQSGRYPIVSFSNSDPRMVKVFMKYLRDGLGVKDNQIKPRVHIHPNIEAVRAIEFWAKTTELSKENFYTFEQISRASKLIRKKNFLPYGTLNIRVNKRQLFYKIKGYINGIIRKLDYN